MKKRIIDCLLLAVCSLGFTAQVRGQATAFTYQGHLNTDGAPARGVYDFLFQAFDAPAAGNNLGGIVSVNGVGVTNGMFTALVDLGGTPFTSPARWLQISVATNGAGNFATLAPRQPLTPSPFAIYAHTAGTVTNGGIANAQLAANSIATANIQNNTITAGKIASGQVVKSLNGLSDGVSITGGANVTISTVGNSVQVSSPPGGLTMPFSGSASSTGSVFTVSNSGAGPAAAFFGKVGVGTASPATLLHARGAGPVMILQDTASAANQAGYVGFWNNVPAETGWMGFGSPGIPDFSVLNARAAGDILLYAGPAGGAVSVTRGNFGIGTTTPAAALDVRGDIRLGPSGQFRATSGQENLRIVRGVVTMTECCVAPVISAGTGFTVSRIGAGTFEISFTTPFAGRPALSVTCRESVGTGEAFATTQSVFSGGARVLTYVSSTDSIFDRSFDFIAIGPR